MCGAGDYGQRRPDAGLRQGQRRRGSLRPVPTALYTVAFPALDDDDAALIRALRGRHDPASAARIDAHFTLVFGHTPDDAAAHLAHVEAVARGALPFEFDCPRVLADDELGRPTCYVAFGVGDGHAHFEALHAALHETQNGAARLADVAFTPHLTLAARLAPLDALSLAEALNARHVVTAGRIEALTVGEVIDDRFVTRAVFPLGR